MDRHKRKSLLDSGFIPLHEAVLIHEANEIMKNYNFYRKYRDNIVFYSEEYLDRFSCGDYTSYKCEKPPPENEITIPIHDRPLLKLFGKKG